MEVIGSNRNKTPLVRWKTWCYNYNDNKTLDGRSKGCRALSSHIPVEKIRGGGKNLELPAQYVFMNSV